MSDESVFNVAQIETLPVSASKLRKATRNDPILGRVLKGWPNEVPDVLKPYWIRWTKLTVEGGSVFWGIRVLVPKC